MKITLAHLIAGFQSAMTMQGLADYLGVAVEEVRARLTHLTSDEEQQINDAMGGK